MDVSRLTACSPVEDSANSANVPALKSRYPELMSSFLIILLCIHTKYHNG